MYCNKRTGREQVDEADEHGKVVCSGFLCDFFKDWKSRYRRSSALRMSSVTHEPPTIKKDSRVHKTSASLSEFGFSGQ